MMNGQNTISLSQKIRPRFWKNLLGTQLCDGEDFNGANALIFEFSSASEIEKKAKMVASKNETTISFSSIDINASPALMNKQIQSLIIDSANQLNYSFKKMPSGAGHDAQDMAIIVPSGMIFIPSIDGISHSPKEFSTDEAVYKGVNVLLNTVLKLDKVKFW